MGLLSTFFKDMEVLLTGIACGAFVGMIKSRTMSGFICGMLKSKGGKRTEGFILARYISGWTLFVLFFITAAFLRQKLFMASLTGFTAAEIVFLTSAIIKALKTAHNTYEVKAWDKN